MTRMSRSRLLRDAALVVAVILLGGGSFLWGDKHALDTQVITRATPDQLANAMQQDAFYSDYRGRTLLVTATIVSVTDRAGAKIVKLATTSSLTVLCNLDQAPAITHAGDAVTWSPREPRLSVSPPGSSSRAVPSHIKRTVLLGRRRCFA